MQDDVRKKVFVDLFVSKSTLLPVVVGSSATLLAWAIDVPVIMLGGVAATLVGGGVFLTRFLFNLEKVTEDACNYVQEKKEKEFEVSLDNIAENFKDPKEKEQFNFLRQSYKIHKDKIKTGDVLTTDDLELKLDNLFKGCIEQLKYANELIKMIESSNNRNSQKSIFEKRQKVLTEIKDSIQCFNTVIEEIYSLNTQRSTKNLADLREQLKSEFEIIKRTEARVAELEDRRN